MGKVLFLYYASTNNLPFQIQIIFTIFKIYPSFFAI